MLISELIAKLEKIKDQYGDNITYINTTDWEGGTYYLKVKGVELIKDADDIRVEIHDGLWDYSQEGDSWIRTND